LETFEDGAASSALNAPVKLDQPTHTSAALSRANARIVSMPAGITVNTSPTSGSLLR
jgi:hypothetical protein